MAAAHPSDPDPDLLGPAAARLIARFGRHLDPDTIRRMLQDTYSALQRQATVTTFLPLLAERSAATRLAKNNANTDDGGNQSHTDAPTHRGGTGGTGAAGVS